LTKVALLHELTFITSVSFASASGAVRNLSTHIGVYAVTIAASDLCCAIVSDLMLVTSMPDDKPIIVSANASPAAPHRRYVHFCSMIPSLDC